MRKLVVLFLLLSSPLMAQTATIHGRVTLPDGSPLPGVTVSIEGTSVTSITDADGRYTLSTPARGSVKVTTSLQGFQTKSPTTDARAGDVTQDFVLRVTFGQEITVGSRATSAEAERAVPMDVIPRQQIATPPSTKTNHIINQAAPSF